MKKINCWEFFGCGRAPGGDRVADLGVCPVAAEQRLNGVNSGINGGRACWAMRDVVPCGPKRDNGGNEVTSCADCGFRIKVILEESFNYQSVRQVREQLQAEGARCLECYG